MLLLIRITLNIYESLSMANGITVQYVKELQTSIVLKIIVIFNKKLIMHRF